MKKLFTLCLVLLLAFCCLNACAEDVVINRIKNEQPNFQFDPQAKLLEVYFPKIHGVDAALVRYGEYTMLIDCAGNQSSEVLAMLEKLGITELTYAVNSHPDADHIGGFNKVLKKIPAGEFLLGFPEDYPSGDDVRFRIYDDLHAQGIPFRRVQNGDAVDFGDVKVTVYQRTDESLPRVNNKSVMLMFEYGERRIFFTGDIQAAAQKLLIAEADQFDLDADILKVPHHGYGNMQEGFIEMVSPAFVVCTGGSTSMDGVRQLAQKGIPYALANKGLRLATDGKTWTVERP